MHLLLCEVHQYTTHSNGADGVSHAATNDARRLKVPPHYERLELAGKSRFRVLVNPLVRPFGRRQQAVLLRPHRTPIDAQVSGRISGKSWSADPTSLPLHSRGP